MISAMAMIDPEQERQRLSEVYLGKTDGELEQVAERAHDLSDIASEALRAELTKRGLYVGQLDDEAPSEERAEFRDLVVIRSYWNLMEAELARGLLDSAGIEAFLFDDNMVRLDWFNANALGGVKLRVDASNVEAANRVLEESISNAAAAEEPDSTE
jgi:hypothetical protein